MAGGAGDVFEAEEGAAAELAAPSAGEGKTILDFGLGAEEEAVEAGDSAPCGSCKPAACATSLASL